LLPLLSTGVVVTLLSISKSKPSTTASPHGLGWLVFAETGPKAPQRKLAKFCPEVSLAMKYSVLAPPPSDRKTFLPYVF
jgi:hypothetical protein